MFWSTFNDSVELYNVIYHDTYIYMNMMVCRMPDASAANTLRFSQLFIFFLFLLILLTQIGRYKYVITMYGCYEKSVTTYNTTTWV